MFNAKTYPIKTVAAMFIDSRNRVTTDLMWRLQQGFADAKFKIMQMMLDEDMVPVNDAEFDWEIVVRGRVSSRAIDSEATDGNWIELPLNMHHFTVAKSEPLSALYA